MKKELKSQIIESISAHLQQYPNFYLTNIEGLNAENTVKLRRACFEQGIKLCVVKNTLFAHVIKGIESEELQSLLPILEGNTAVMFCESPNAPAKLIKKLQKDFGEKPELKGAYVQECAFIGADKLEELCAIKSKEELIGDIISLLQARQARGTLRYQVQGRAHRRHHLPPPGSYAQCHFRSPEWWRTDNRRSCQDSLGKRIKILTINNLKIINYGRCKSTCGRVG